MPNPFEASASSARSAAGQTQPARFQELTALLMAEYERVRHALDHALEYGGPGKLPELSQVQSKLGGTAAAAPQPPEPKAPPEPGSQGTPSASAAAAAAAAAEAVLAALAPDAWNGLDLLDSNGDAAAAPAANCPQSNSQEEKLLPVWSEVAWQDSSKDDQATSHFLHAKSWGSMAQEQEQEESASSRSRASTSDSSSLEDEETDPEVDADKIKEEVRRSSKRRHSYLEDIQVTFRKGRRFGFVKSPYFDYLTSVVLLTNAFVMGLQVDFSVRNSTEILPFHFRWMDWVFLACFTAELLLRLMAYGCWNFFRGPGWGWNCVDTLLVGAQMVEEVMTVVVDMGFSSDGLDVNFGAFRVLRVLRLTRLVRLVRLVRLIRELHAMVLSILSSVRSFLWACALLFLIIYVMAIFVAQSVVQMESRGEALEKHTGSLPLIIFSLFQSMSGGLDWGQMAAPLVEETGLFTAVAFTVFIAFTVFVMMNVVTGVFVDAAQNSIKEEKEKDLLLRLKEAFTVMDEDNSRTLSWKEFKKQLAHPRMIDYFKAVDLDVTHARSLFTLLEMGDGTVSIDDFVFGCLRLCGPARAIDQAMTGRELTRVLKEVKTKVKALRRDIWRLSQRADRPSIVVSRINNSTNSLSEKAS